MLGGIMDKEDYIESLFNDIKDSIAFDSDVIAIHKLLEAMLKINYKKAIRMWKYIIESYDIKNLKREIDFELILNLFPSQLFNKIEIKNFFQILQDISYVKRNEINKIFFNVYDDKSGLYIILKDLIINSKKKQEREFINLVLKYSAEFPKDIFDLNIFLKKIILIHINSSSIDNDFLINLTEIPSTAKDRAILKALLIGYI